MWMKGSRLRRSTPAKARRTGKPSPSKPDGAGVTETVWRSGSAVGAGPGVLGTARWGVNKLTLPKVVASSTIPGSLSGMDETRWLDAEQQGAWRAYLETTRLLLRALNQQLEDDAGISLTDYELL